MALHMYIAYVLQNKEGKLYKGVTNDMERRVKEHNWGKTKTTRNMGQLVVVYSESFDTFEEARKREVYFKSSAGRRFLKKKLRA